MQKNALATHRRLAGARWTSWQQLHHAVGVERQQAIMNVQVLDSFTNSAAADSDGELDVAVGATVPKGTLEANSEEQFAVVAADSAGAAFASAASGTLPGGSAGQHTACWAERKAAHILTLAEKIAASDRCCHSVLPDHPYLGLLRPFMHSFTPRGSATGQVPLAARASAGSLAFRHCCIDTAASSTGFVTAAGSFASINVGSCWGSYQDAAKIRCCWARKDVGSRRSCHRFALAYSWLAD